MQRILYEETVGVPRHPSRRRFHAGSVGLSASKPRERGVSVVGHFSTVVRQPLNVSLSPTDDTTDDGAREGRGRVNASDDGRSAEEADG